MYMRILTELLEHAQLSGRLCTDSQEYGCVSLTAKGSGQDSPAVGGTVGTPESFSLGSRRHIKPLSAQVY